MLNGKELLTASRKYKKINRMDNNNLVHIRWKCKYHIILTPKYCRRRIYRKFKIDADQILLGSLKSMRIKYYVDCMKKNKTNKD